MFSTHRDHKPPAWRLGLAPALLILIGAFAGHPGSANAASLRPLSPPWVDEPDLQPDAASGATGEASADVTPAATDAAADASASAPTSPDAALADAIGGDDSGFTAMDDKEMAGARGGFDGIAFGIILTGTLNTPASTNPPPGVSVTTLNPGQVEIIGGLGNLAGANGIFQITNVIGDLNTINNNVIINVTIQNSAPNIPNTPIG